MSMVSNKSILMDYDSLENQIRAKATVYSWGNTSEDLIPLIESSKMIAFCVLEDFFYSIDDYYTKGDNRISDEVVLRRFADFYDGYRAKMKAWMNSNEIIIRGKHLPIDESFEIPISMSSNNHIVILVIGTLIAIGLSFITKLWLSIPFELLVIGFSAFLYRRNKKREKEYCKRLAEYERCALLAKSRWLNSLIEDIKSWLKSAEAYSNSLLLLYVGNYGTER